MSHLQLTSPVTITCSSKGKSRCYAYAVAECGRLLGRAGIKASVAKFATGAAGPLRLQLSKPGAAVPKVPAKMAKVDGDSYMLVITTAAATIFAKEAKGILNGVYDLAEQLGFTFLLPEESGEWVPETGLQPLPTGVLRRISQFAHRGVFWEAHASHDYSPEAWLRFYAKLRFNAVAHEVGSREVCEQLGIRLEAGGHGFSKSLPRNLFEQQPDLFRMMQPADFKGQRMADANLCVTNPEAVKIVQQNFAAQLKNYRGIHALHAWPDDLPAGGWCLCPTCRSFTPQDQAMLAVKIMAEAVREQRLGLQIPYIAYHDTMTPGTQLTPPPESFLLFAPRERCYGHALDDPKCARNQFYLKCLDDNLRKFRNHADAHTFEYYFDQILFRGMYPYLPDLIIQDMKTYRQAGIKTHLSLQVAGPELAPEFNMLVFARAAWDAQLDAAGFNTWMAARLCPAKPGIWKKYLDRRATLYREALQMCDHDLGIYLDYRWLPQTTAPFGRKMAQIYRESSRELAQAGQELARSLGGGKGPARLAKLVKTEVARAKFEAAELEVMHHQQLAMNASGEFTDTGAAKARRTAVAELQRTIAAFRQAWIQAVAFGLPEKAWYFRNINRWLAAELAEHFLKKLS